MTTPRRSTAPAKGEGRTAIVTQANHNTGRATKSGALDIAAARHRGRRNRHRSTTRTLSLDAVTDDEAVIHRAWLDVELHRMHRGGAVSPEVEDAAQALWASWCAIGRRRREREAALRGAEAAL
jgi:hypothetical protein